MRPFIRGFCVSPLLFLGVYLSVVVNAIITEQDLTTYFASIDRGVYINWLNENQILSSYTNSLFLPSPLGSKDGVALHWKIDGDYLRLVVATRASGWVGFGIAESGGMKGADIVYYTAETNELTDSYVLDDIQNGPIKDTKQDWKLESSQTIGGFIIFEASRLVDTGDSQDRRIFNDGSSDVSPSRIIAAWGDSESIQYHGPNSRVRSAIRFNATYSGGSVVDQFHSAMAKEADGYFDLLADSYPVKQTETEYVDFCLSRDNLIDQGVPVDEDLHIIGFEPKMHAASAPYVHHYQVYSYSSDHGKTGTCNLEPKYLLQDFIYGWAPGYQPIEVPSAAGVPIVQSFMINIHYNNPNTVGGIVDRSGVRFYYTRTKRQHDLGVLRMGDPALVLRSTNVGEGLTKHTFGCPSSCSNTALIGTKDEEVTVVSEVLHMHSSGVKIDHKQIRNGTVIRTGNVDFWDFDQQGAFAVQQPAFTIKPGDSFDLSCYFSNDNNNNNTDRKFGLASDDEMCIAYLFYYPKIPFLELSLPGVIDDFHIPHVCSYGLEKLSPIASFCSADYSNNNVADGEFIRSFGSDNSNIISPSPTPTNEKEQLPNNNNNNNTCVKTHDTGCTENDQCCSKICDQRYENRSYCRGRAAVAYRSKRLCGRDDIKRGGSRCS